MMTRSQIVQGLARDFAAQSLAAQLGEVESPDQLIDGQDPLMAFVAWCREQANEAAIAANIADLGGKIPEKYRAAGYVEMLVRDFLFEKAGPLLDSRAIDAEEFYCSCGASGIQRCECDADDEGEMA